jgi:hypothetical protein
MIKVKDFINTQLYEMTIEVRDENNYALGVFPTNSEALTPYLEREVKTWFPRGEGIGFAVVLGERRENE